MAETAADRKYKRKRIKIAGSEENYVDIPVIYEAHFKTMAEQAQERFLYFDNSINSSRKVHVKQLYSSYDPDKTGAHLDVERIDSWFSKEIQSQAQEFEHVMVNTDPPPIQVDGSNNPAHEKVHYVRYFKDNDSSSNVWVDVELIDELKIRDTVSQAQDWIYYTKHPEIGEPVNDPTIPYDVTVGYCDPALELAPDESAQGIDPPYRIDPFQNIINFCSTRPIKYVRHMFHYVACAQQTTTSWEWIGDVRYFHWHYGPWWPEPVQYSMPMSYTGTNADEAAAAIETYILSRVGVGAWADMTFESSDGIIAGPMSFNPTANCGNISWAGLFAYRCRLKSTTYSEPGLPPEAYELVETFDPDLGLSGMLPFVPLSLWEPSGWEPIPG